MAVCENNRRKANESNENMSASNEIMKSSENEKKMKNINEISISNVGNGESYQWRNGVSK
jgi:hypothetical protein